MARFFKHYRGLDAELAKAGVPVGPPQSVLIQLMTYNNLDLDGVMHPSTGRISEMTGLSRRSVQRAFDIIEKSGLLKPTTPRGRGFRGAVVWETSPLLKGILAELESRE